MQMKCNEHQHYPAQQEPPNRNNKETMKRILSIMIFFAVMVQAVAQDTLSLHHIIMHINQHSEHLQMFDAEIQSEQEAANSAFAWMPPEVSTGFWMAPYNPKYLKGENGTGGMGQYMISGQQMFPNKKAQHAEYNYLKAMSSITQERREAVQNELYGEAKTNFYQWLVLRKKTQVLSENEKLVEFMISTAEIKYKNNTGDITAYYKAKAALGNIHTMRVQLDNEIVQKRIALNTLMHRDRMYYFEIDTSYVVKDFSTMEIDSNSLVQSRSDIAAETADINLTTLQQQVEQNKLLPQFGVRYDHMMGLGNMPAQFSLMGMMKIPFARWSSRGVKANVESLKWKAVAQQKQREATINEALGEAYGVKTEIEQRKKQISLYEQEIMPALKRNYQTTQLAYEQNTEKLFVLYDAWDAYNKIQLEYLDELQQLLMLQAKLETILEIEE